MVGSIITRGETLRVHGNDWGPLYAATYTWNFALANGMVPIGRLSDLSVGWNFLDFQAYFYICFTDLTRSADKTIVHVLMGAHYAKAHLNWVGERSFVFWLLALTWMEEEGKGNWYSYPNCLILLWDDWWDCGDSYLNVWVFQLWYDNLIW